MNAIIVHRVKGEVYMIHFDPSDPLKAAGAICRWWVNKELNFSFQDALYCAKRVRLHAKLAGQDV